MIAPAAAVLAAFAFASFESFHPLIAMGKLAMACVIFAAIGRAAAFWLGLGERAKEGSPGRPRLAIAHDILLGQVLSLGYLYARSLLSDTLGLPGVSQIECFVVLGGMAIAYATRERTTGATSGEGTPRLDRAVVIVLWLSWLVWIAFQKLDLHFTPSSDPDIHAFYARTLLERGQIFYDLLPNSDSWMIYPSAFASLNFVWGVFSGLHPVQLVNVAAHVQWTLLVGAVLGLLVGPRCDRPVDVVLAALHFTFAYLGFNAVFADGRAFLEGTPRLAHTALLVYPLLFALRYREDLHRQPWLWLVPAFATALGACVNPTHVPAMLLAAAAACAVAQAPRRLAKPIGAALVIALAVAWTDPFYRGLAAQQTAPAAEREAATDLTGQAFAARIDLARIVSHGLPDSWQRLAAMDRDDAATRWLRRIAWLSALITLVMLGYIAKRAGPDREDAAPPHPRAPLFYGRFAVVVLHALWTAVVPAFGQAEVLQTRLLTQYTRALQEQLELVFLAVVPLALLATAMSLPAAIDAGGRKRLRWAFVAALVALPFLLTSAISQRTAFHAALRESPLGAVHRGDVEFARRVADHVPADERVLLPGRTRRLPGEHWVFTTDAGRALPLFTDAPTSFFLGLDGWAFTAGAYQAHVAPPRFDPTWLRAQRIDWLLDSGQLPPQLVKQHYDLALRGDNAVLWRLREAASGGGAPAP
jgi:hypothetical protein